MRTLRAAVRGERGFTLGELVVTIAVLGVMMAGIFTIMTAGQQSYVVGSSQVEAQQNVRLAIERMIQEIRGAGYDPTGNAAFTAISSQSAAGFTLQYDWDGDGAINAATAVVAPGGVTRGEQVIYSVAGGNLSRREIGIDASPVVVAPVRAVTFGYLDAAGNATGTAANIRAVTVTVTAGGSTGATTYTLGDVSVTMTDTVRLRNRAN